MKVRPIHFVPDLDEAVRFYAALGLVPHARSRVGNWVELEGSGGELGVHDGPSADDGAGRDGVVFSFVAEEPLEAVERRLRAAGFAPQDGVVDREWGRSLLVIGPGGMLVQIDEQDHELYT